MGIRSNGFTGTRTHRDVCNLCIAGGRDDAHCVVTAGNKNVGAVGAGGSWLWSWANIESLNELCGRDVNNVKLAQTLIRHIRGCVHNLFL